jgi:hypothetical protein
MENKSHRTRDKSRQIAEYVRDAIKVIGKIPEGLP